MKKEDLRIVYMGTPDFAVESLRALVEGGYNIVGVITMPDKPVGRHGSVLQLSLIHILVFGCGGIFSIIVRIYTYCNSEEVLSCRFIWGNSNVSIFSFSLIYTLRKMCIRDSYYTTYPKGEFTELARYYSGYGLYLDSPDPRLDQAQTYEAINQLQLYLEYYPQSERAKEAQNIMFELQEKLAYKELLAVRLYFNLGTYMGNNYLSCVITAHNALKNYPYSKYREEFMFYTIRAKYELAVVSVEEKLQGRYREVVDVYKRQGCNKRGEFS